MVAILGFVEAASVDCHLLDVERDWSRSGARVEVWRRREILVSRAQQRDMEGVFNVIAVLELCRNAVLIELVFDALEISTSNGKSHTT
jgi:hypothetical protein